MSFDKIRVSHDPRVSHETTNLNGRKYHYLLAEPQGSRSGTIFLIHGWPDISMGWRYQIPMFLERGLRVVVPDIMGFGRTEAPMVPPEPMSCYSFKQAAFDIKELADQLGAPQIILGGHDWGGAIVFRVCLWIPNFVTHLFSVCTPYSPPDHRPFVSLEEKVRTALPNFAYQIHLGSGEVQKIINSKETIRQFLNGVYGGRGKEGELVFTAEKGVIFENLPKVGPSPLLSREEIDYYVDEYSRNGMSGNLNWYKTQRQNYEDELELKASTIDIPVLFIFATKDVALPRWMSRGMGKNIPNLTRDEIEASHWVLWEKPSQVNSIIQSWLEAEEQKPIRGNL